ncbi:sulfatase-like hydrolase/transferase [Rhodococcus pyridinivorans]|uniref:sulfatase-like hydrolase/transferase n=1 Tax=Rhodococcus pyridinivorans TaxID=103816 RepID=UPI0020789769|nr:sulfatase-like hydrolase/transferase [Rhodococcus pyridinivorans]USI91254.1 sulfatase-like hydrolase/transferase [Rhodococcus pyridinivorans]
MTVQQAVPRRDTTWNVNRRTFLVGAGALLAAGLVGAGSSAAQPRTPQRPNILIIMTDQERQPMHWPADWARNNLPNRQRLADTGLTFTRSFCNAAMCSPSRSTFFTGLYPAQHGVVSTLTEGGTLSPTEPVLPVDGQNMAKMLLSAGYDVHYRGKWHMSKGADGGDPSPDDIARYGFAGWEPPEAGQDTAPENFGGGCADRDGKIASDAAEFLRSRSASDDRPFALIVSFANPHDILSYPKTWDQVDGDCNNYGAFAPEAFEQGIDLPPTIDEDLLRNFKPTAQAELLLLLAGALGPLVGPEAARQYVNLYAYMHKVVDQHIGTVLDALESVSGLRERTVVFRVADHGEMGLSHGGLRQKAFNAYEETLNVPLVVSNPVMFPRPVSTDALASLIDVMPTLATMAAVPDRSAWTFKGVDLTPVIEGASSGGTPPQVQDTVLFTFDDENAAAANGQTTVKQPNHIRAVRQDRWKYAMYFDPSGRALPQFELYDLHDDPLETRNRANPLDLANFDPVQVATMHAVLMDVMARTGTTPAVTIPQFPVPSGSADLPIPSGSAGR